MKQVRFLSCLILGVVVLSSSASAAIYNFEAYGNTLDGPIGTTISGPCTSQSFTSQTLSVSNCSSAPGVKTSADSLATYTVLHADSSLTLSNATLPNGIFASGYARTVDSLSLISLGVAYVGFTFQVDGTLTDSGLSQAVVVMSFGFDYANGGVPGVLNSQCLKNITSGSQAVHFSCGTRLYPVSVFQQYEYFFSFATQEINNTSANPVSGSASSNFFNSATLVSVQPYDANFHFVPGATIASLGNNGVPFANAPVPEPSTLFGVGGVLALLAFVRHRRAFSLLCTS
jgi:PEP-CTERM motif